MDKKELIISLMKLDKFYNKKIDELNAVLGRNSCVECFYPDGNIKSISEIVFDIVCIPEETAEESVFYVGTPEDAEKGFDEGYCRDAVIDIYYKATDPSEGNKITIEKVAEILTSVGENKGYFLPKHEKYIG
ncbi:hypothetical protein ES695_17860 [Candidatus Atribacteria bacterium 1244-E10-H5-B2]|nr:MAG: hypothetical protein ES695_17860 [Candidatus Atribacteria bacterium 1244-E10-H5-B2]